MPEIKDPNKKILNDPIILPDSDVRDPIKPARLLTSNPRLLVIYCIKFESKGELTIEPIIIKEIGKVP